MSDETKRPIEPDPDLIGHRLPPPGPPYSLPIRSPFGLCSLCCLLFGVCIGALVMIALGGIGR
jgi:hypothetical protein